jgi:titin
VSIQRTAFQEPIDNKVQGNFIGTDVTGTLAIANQSDGISLGEGIGGMGGMNLQIGGPTSAARNVISGNRQNGITLRGFARANPNHIEGNFIGTNAFGTGALGNGLNGVLITAGTTDGHHIGANSAGAANVIAFNGADGIASDAGRVIGGPVLSNSIFTNSGLGIDRGSDGITANGSTRTDNTPVLTTVNTNGGTTTINGTLQQNHTTSVNYTVQFFSNLSCDPSGFGEGQTFIGQTTVNVTNNQPVSFTANISPPVPGGRFITAVAVGPSSLDPTGPSFSSEFSFCFQNNGSAPADQTPLRVLAIAPNQGGDIGSLTSTVTGEGIRQGATVLLRKSGETDIV